MLGFDLKLSQSKIDIFRYSTKHEALRWELKLVDSTRHDNMFEWSDMSHTRQLLFHSCSITKIKFSALVGYKASYRQTLICSRQSRSCRGVLDRTLCSIKFVSDYGSSVVFSTI